MSAKRENYPLHEIAKVEQKLKLLYFLRDLGITQAEKAKEDAFKIYMYIVGEMT